MSVSASSISEFAVEKTWQADRSSPLRWVASHALRYKHLILIIVIGAFGNGVGAGAVALFVGHGFNIVTTSGDLRALMLTALALIGSQLVRGVLMLGRNMSAEMLGQLVERNTREELYLNLLGKNMAFHDSHATGDLMARATNDVREINLLFNPGMNLVIGSINFIIAPFILVPTLSPQLLLVPTLYAIIYGILLVDYLRQLRPATRAVRARFGDLNANLAEAIDGIEAVKGAAQEKRETGKFKTSLWAWRNAFVWQGDVEARFLPLLLLGALQAAGLLHSLLLYRQGVLQLGDVVAFNGMLVMFQFPTFAAQFAYSHVATGLASAQRVLSLINTQTDLDQNIKGYDGEIDGNINFSDVTFSYNGSTNALQGIDFKVESGQTVAIVGQTGAGKSTIAKLINRTYDVSAGGIEISGVDVKDWNLAALRRQISIIEQDIYLFSRSVADNIAFGVPHATQAQIEAAAKAAQAHDFITDFSDGYQTVIGQRGVTLSGGQRQRLALARAFLTNPKILILDDSTSAIDSATEDRIQKAIEAAAQGRTTILITHRLSQIRWADKIVVLKGGKLAMVGNHDTLLAESEAYRNIFARYE